MRPHPGMGLSWHLGLSQTGFSLMCGSVCFSVCIARNDTVQKGRSSIDLLLPRHPGTGNPDRVWGNLDVFGFELTEDEMSRINGLDRTEKHEW